MDGAGSYSVAHRAGLLPTELTGMWGWILLRSPHQGRGSPPAPAPTKQRPGRAWGPKFTRCAVGGTGVPAQEVEPRRLRTIQGPRGPSGGGMGWPRQNGVWEQWREPGMPLASGRAAGAQWQSAPYQRPLSNTPPSRTTGTQ